MSNTPPQKTIKNAQYFRTKTQEKALKLSRDAVEKYTSEVATAIGIYLDGEKKTVNTDHPNFSRFKGQLSGTDSEASVLRPFTAEMGTQVSPQTRPAVREFDLPH